MWNVSVCCDSLVHSHDNHIWFVLNYVSEFIFHVFRRLSSSPLHLIWALTELHVNIDPFKVHISAQEPSETDCLHERRRAKRQQSAMGGPRVPVPPGFGSKTNTNITSPSGTTLLLSAIISSRFIITQRQQSSLITQKILTLWFIYIQQGRRLLLASLWTLTLKRLSKSQIIHPLTLHGSPAWETKILMTKPTWLVLLLN